jgi:hypothetical protein
VKWYADNSDLKGIKDADLNDIFLIGGIAIDARSESGLRSGIERVKGATGYARSPVKWNMKDLREHYERHNDLKRYDYLLRSSAEWRPKIFGCIAASNATIILACVEGYSVLRQVQKRTKEGLVRYAFNNGLMRFGLHVKEIGAAGASVVMDWPDGGDPKPFNIEYAFAFGRGSTPDKIPYRCGKLRDLGFSDSVNFTNTRHSTLLQAADLVVGASRELIECCLGKRGPGPGVECLRIVRDRFRGAPSNIVGRGLSISSGNDALVTAVRIGLQQYLWPT